MFVKKRVFLWPLIFILGACAPMARISGVRYPCEWPGSPGFSGDIDRQGIIEPSGICFHPARKTLFIVSDDGEIIEMKTDGTPVFRQRVPGDLEAVTVDPQSGLVYIAVEGDDVILEYDSEKRMITRRFPIRRDFQGNPNFLQKQTDRYDNGIEALAFVPRKGHPEGGTFYAGNQDDPPCILELSVPLHSGGSGGGEARIIRVLPVQVGDPSDLSYDGQRNVLAVIDDADNIYAEITPDGRLVAEYAFPGNCQEGIAWDDEGFLYIAQDSGGIIKLKDHRRR